MKIILKDEIDHIVINSVKNKLLVYTILYHTRYLK